MQLPNHLLRTYRKYKLQEKELLEWIASAAEIVDYKDRSTSNVPTPPTTPKATKLKGRARTEARRKKQSDSDRSSQLPDESYEAPRFSLFDILAPIKAIAADPRITSIPVNIARKLLEVLKLRQKCMSWYKSNTDENDRETLEQNRKHAYPVRLLQQVISTLKNKSPRDTVSHDQEESTATHVRIEPACGHDEEIVTEFNNLFNHLRLDEELEDSFGVLDSPGTYSTTTDFGNETYVRISQQDRAQDEYDLARYCFYEDVQEIEDHVVLELVRYAIDQANADTLPLIITTAVDLVSQMFALLHERKNAYKLKHNFEWPLNSVREDRKIASPVFRLQDMISFELMSNAAWKQIQRQDHQDCCLGKACKLPPEPFPRNDADEEYLTADLRQQFKTEHNYIFSLWTEDTPSNYAQFLPYWFDVITKCLHMLKYGHDKNNFGAFNIPVGPTFGIRICLLATVILQDRKEVAFRNLQKTAIQTSIDAASWKPLQPKLTVNQGEVLTHTLKFISDSTQKPKGLLDKRFEASFRINPILSCKNTLAYRLFNAIWGAQIIDRTYMFRTLAHLWNLLREEGYLKTDWPAVHYIQNMLGEYFIYQGDRPTISGLGGKKTLRSRVLYSYGYKAKDIANLTKYFLTRDKSTHSKLPRTYAHNFFVSRDWALTCFLMQRDQADVRAHDAVQDVAAIVNATYIQPLVGKPVLHAHFGGTEQTYLENKAELQRLYSKSPQLSSVDLLSSVKKCLNHEMRITEFNYLPFTQAFVELIDNLLIARNNLRDSPVAGFTMLHSGDKLNRVVLDLLLFGKETKFKVVAKVFEDWLSKYGSVGSAGFPRAKPKMVCPLPLRPDVVKFVQDIVARRGLRDDVFTSEQVYGLGEGVKVTESFEQHIKDIWARQRGI